MNKPSFPLIKTTYQKLQNPNTMKLFIVRELLPTNCLMFDLFVGLALNGLIKGKFIVQ